MGRVRHGDPRPVARQVAGLAHEWDGFDMVLVANLTDHALLRPQVGAGADGHLVSLIRGGWARSPLFGGSGYETLDNLPAHGVWAMLAPEGSTDFNMCADGCSPAFDGDLALGEAVYLTPIPEPTTLGLLLVGGAAFGWTRTRARKRS